ncbi:MAG: 2-C-methyl-D-erythritol 4-phosphate cytidylyltransferase [Phycisphaerales bacterium JB039]
MRFAIIIPAAGFSSRFADALGGEGRSKLDEDLGGRPVLQRTVELFHKRDDVIQIVVAGPHADDAWEAFSQRHADKLAILGVTLCRGGQTHRYETVRAALAEIRDDATYIAVHDAARPCTPSEVIGRVFDAAAKFDAVIPAVEVGDTLKRVSEQEEAAAEADPIDAILGADPDDKPKARQVEATLDRTRLVAVQTPQVFKAELLRRAYGQDDLTSTDDAQLVERLGEPVYVVDGDPRNIKITRPADVRLARSILGVSGPQGRPAHKRF